MACSLMIRRRIRMLASYSRIRESASSMLPSTMPDIWIYLPPTPVSARTTPAGNAQGRELTL